MADPLQVDAISLGSSVKQAVAKRSGNISEFEIGRMYAGIDTLITVVRKEKNTQAG